MFAFACIAGGLIVACTVFALLVLSGPEFTLSDIAQQMETMHRSRPLTRSGIAGRKTGPKPESGSQFCIAAAEGFSAFEKSSASRSPSGPLSNT
jgi:hypothetical protein